MKKYKFNFNDVKYVLSYCIRFDKTIFYIFVLYAIFIALNQFIGLLLPKYIIDEVFNGTNIKILIIYIFFFFVISSFWGYIIPFLKNKCEPRIMKIRLMFIELFNKKILNIEYKHLEDPQVLNEAETALRAISNNTTGIEGFLNNIFNLGGVFLSIVAYISIIGKLNVFVLIFLICSVMLSFALTFMAKKYEYGKRNDISQLERKANYLTQIMHDFSYAKEIRIYNLSYWILKKFNCVSKEILSVNKKINSKYLCFSIINAFINIFREIIIYFYLIHSVLNSTISVGEFTVYFTAIFSFSDIMSSLFSILVELRTQILYISDYRKFMEFETTRHKETYLLSPPLGEDITIEFKNVYFKYPKTDTYILKNISFKINSGEKLALVGSNGSGKTTLIKLICGLYQPTKGQILINNIDINCFDKTEYYKLFSILFQDFKLFAFTIYQNTTLIMGKNEKSIKKAEEAYSLTGMSETIDKLEKGMDTNIYKMFDDCGIELSGGEEQKIALSRALYKEGKIIILDEPTASLDPVSECRIYEKFNDLTKNKTSIYISHRLSSVKFCDKVLYLDDGEIKGLGSHEDLVKQNITYAKMYNLQSQYYIK